MTLEHVKHMIHSALCTIGTSSSVVHTLQVFTKGSDDLVDWTPARTKEVVSMGYLGSVVPTAAARPAAPALPSFVAPATYSPTTLAEKIGFIGVLAEMSGARAPHTGASASELVARMDSSIAAVRGALPFAHRQRAHAPTPTQAQTVSNTLYTLPHTRMLTRTHTC